MKLSKLMLSACIAALALVSCNKQDTTPEISGRLKTVEISLENIQYTKAPTDAFLKATDQVILNSFKIFLTDGSTLYTTIEGAPEVQKFYYSNVTEALPETATIDYVPAAVNKVVVVGNVEESWGEGYTTYADLKAATLSVDAQQDYKTLTLYGEGGLTSAGTVHDHEDNKTYNVYEAAIQVAPLIARFELDGFAMEFSAENSKYDKVEVKQIALNNYYTETTLSPLAPASLMDRVGTVNDVNAFKFFADNILATDVTWYYDVLPEGDVVLARPAAAGADGKFIVVDDMTGKKAYHFFPGSAAPQIFLELDVYAAGSTTATPSYIYSKGFKTSTGEDVTFQSGYVYRMNFQGTAGDGDGDLPFDEDDINELDRCLEITIEPIKWSVVTIFPEF